jgi:UDP-N-acetylglucosamine 2-epimerase (non-hydrolysing)
MTTSPNPPVRLACIAGTRPECLKLASLVRRATDHPGFTPVVVSSGQHPHMVRATMTHLHLPVDVELAPVPPHTMLSRTVAHLKLYFRQWLKENRPDIVLVQGDTSTAYAGALAAADCGIRLAHLEAGLRTNNPLRPFPEEHFRRCITPLANLHLVPTPGTRDNLLAEKVRPDSIHVVGNSVVDILRESIKEDSVAAVPWQACGSRLVVLTLHRRENYQHGLVNVCQAMLQLLGQHADLCLVCPVHPNPLVGARIRRMLGNHPRILLTPPQPYRDFIRLLQDAALVVTDSGGIQEEAPYLGIPVLVAREETERPEALQNDFVKLVGSHVDALVTEAHAALSQARPAPCGFNAEAPFGDGRTAERVLAILLASNNPGGRHAG